MAATLVGLFTEDEALVERIGAALAPGGAQLAVGATQDAVTRLLAMFDPGLCARDTTFPLAQPPAA
jgi:hypothetical protein